MAAWKTLTYIQKGISHTRNDMGCQDSVLIEENEDCIVAALSDGLGSLRHSKVASQTAVEAIWKYMSAFDQIPDEIRGTPLLPQYLLSRVVIEVKYQASQMNLPLDEMDCTLIFVCIFKKTNRALIGRLGDSAICMISESESIAVNDGIRFTNGTYALLDEDARQHFIIQDIDIDANDIQGFILTSDGLENELYIKGSDHVYQNAQHYFNAWFTGDDPENVIRERIAELTEIEDTPFDDDISIAIISRADKEISLPDDPSWLCTCGYRNYMQDTYCRECGSDFSVLYRKIRFREYGGKLAFFKKINQDPEEELRILEMSKREKEESQEAQSNANSEIKSRFGEDTEGRKARNNVPKAAATRGAGRYLAPTRGEVKVAKNSSKGRILILIVLAICCIVGGLFIRSTASQKSTAASEHIEQSN